jgi:4-hydroxy-tetrahydrodipicolinate reductase
MIKAAVAGAAGHMGQRVVHAIVGTEGIKLTGALEAAGHHSLGQDVGSWAGLQPHGILISDDLISVIKGADVLIDFSYYKASLVHLKESVRQKRAIVIGTTGFSSEALEEVRKIGASTRCVISPNMSVGVNLMLQVIRDVAKALGDDYDVEIIEAHHRRKADAPSGTALRMADVLARSLKRDVDDVAVFARHGQIGPRSAQEIGIQTIRAGDIVGEHTVIFAGTGERIEITHRAHSRDNFARGAVRAAIWAVAQSPGLYDMQDVLGLK